MTAHTAQLPALDPLDFLSIDALLDDEERAIRDTVRGEKQRFAASYTNFLIGNSVVLTPAFNHANDQKARAVLSEFFPGRTVVGIDCTDLIYGAGTLHCISQQQPST